MSGPDWHRMTAVPEYPTPFPPHSPALPTPLDHLSVRRQRRDTLGESIDGGWWPYSLDLGAELPALVAAMLAIGHDVRRVIYHLDSWDPAPRVVTVAGRRLGLSGYRTQDPHVISLIVGPGWDYVNLAVIPPETDVFSARRAMDLAGRDGDGRRPQEILDQTNRPIILLRPDNGLDQLSLARWDSDGGHTSAI